LLKHGGYDTRLLIGQFKPTALPRGMKNIGVRMWAFMPSYKDDVNLSPWYEMNGHYNIEVLMNRYQAEKQKPLVNPAHFIADRNFTFEYGRFTMKNFKSEETVRTPTSLMYGLRRRISRSFRIHSYFSKQLDLSTQLMPLLSAKHIFTIVSGLFFWQQKTKTTDRSK
jgi:hypothetical protein